MIRLRFSKIRLVDMVGILVFVLALVTAVFFFLRRATYVEIVLRASQSDGLEENGLPLWYLDNLKAGMEQKDITGKPTISIVKVQNYPSDAGKRATYLTIRLLTAYDARSGTYSYEGVPLLVGSYQNLRIKGVFLRGVVYQILDRSETIESKKMLVEGYLNPAKIDNQDPYEANMISNGVLNYLADKFNVGATISDNNGVVVATLKSVEKKPAIRKFVSNGQIVETVDGDRKQVLLKVEVKVEKIDGVFLYQGVKPVKTNTNLYLNFGDYDGSMTVVNFKVE